METVFEEMHRYLGNSLLELSDQSEGGLLRSLMKLSLRGRLLKDNQRYAAVRERG